MGRTADAAEPRSPMSGSSGAAQAARALTSARRVIGSCTRTHSASSPNERREAEPARRHCGRHYGEWAPDSFRSGWRVKICRGYPEIRPFDRLISTRRFTVRKRILISLALERAWPCRPAWSSPPGTVERTDLFGQGLGGPVVAEDGASIMRTNSSVIAKVVMATPEPGSYTLGEGATEARSTAVRRRSACGSLSSSTRRACAPRSADLATSSRTQMSSPARSTLVGTSRAGRPDARRLSQCITRHLRWGERRNHRQALAMGYSLADADIHLAVAPHGVLDSELLPLQISTRSGRQPTGGLPSLGRRADHAIHVAGPLRPATSNQEMQR